MALGSYRIPDEFKDEDKYFKFFTKTQLLALLVALGVGIGFLALFSSIGLMPVGLTLLILVVLSAGACVMFPIPEDKYLIGGGEKLYVVVVRVINKKLPMNKVIFVKNYKK